MASTEKTEIWWQPRGHFPQNLETCRLWGYLGYIAGMLNDNDGKSSRSHRTIAEPHFISYHQFCCIYIQDSCDIKKFNRLIIQLFSSFPHSVLYLNGHACLIFWPGRFCPLKNLDRISLLTSGGCIERSHWSDGSVYKLILILSYPGLRVVRF